MSKEMKTPKEQVREIENSGSVRVDAVVSFLGWLGNKYPDVVLTQQQVDMLGAHFNKNIKCFYPRLSGKTFLFNKIKEFEKETGWAKN